MLKRRPPSSLVFLAALVILSIGVTTIAGITIYLETRHTTRTRAEAITGGNATIGRATIARFGCGSCHVISGVSGANGMVGPDLTQIAKRVTIAGSFSNDPETMVRWLMHPQKLRPGSGMPEMGLTEKDARDAAAYLYAQ